MTTAASYSNLVQELYIAYFGRPADYYGLQNFEAALAAANAPTDAAALATAYSSNAAIKTLVDSFGTSAESAALYGSGSTESFVNAIFENLFGRAAAVSGLTFWTDAINAGQVSKGDAALAILAGAEPTSNSTAQATADWNLVQAKVGVATSFTTALGNSSTQIVDYSGATAAQDARLMLASVTAGTSAATFDVQTTINNIVAGNTQNTFTLTTGVDTFLGGTGNNTFNAILDNAAGVAAGGQAATLQAFDTITGGTLNNTLNITDFGIGGQTTIPSGATISGITTLNINTLQGATGDFSTWTGLTALDIKSADGTVSVTVPDATAVTVIDTTGTVSVTGGSTVTAKTNTSNEIIVHGSADTSAVSLTGGVYNDIYDVNSGSGKANSITTVSLTSNGVGGQYSYTTIDSDALTTLNVTSEATGVYIDAAAGTRTLTVNLDGVGPGYTSSTGAWIEDNTATTLIVNAINNASSVYLQANSATSVTFNDTVDLSISEFVLESAKNINITGAGDFSADLSGDAYATAAIDATASSGVVTVTLAAGQSFTGGTGQDMIYIGAGQTGAVTGGSATNNEIVLDNAPGATVADIAATKNFSIFGVAGTTSGSFDMSKVSGYTSFDVQESSGNVTFTNAATGSSLSLEGGNSHIVTLQTVDGNGASDTVNVSLGTTTSAGSIYAEVTLEDSAFVGTATVNLTSNVSNSATGNTLTSLNDNNLVTLNIGGTGNVEIDAVSTLSTSVSINNSAVATGLSLLIGDLTDNHLGTLTLGGAQGMIIDNLTSTSTSLTIVDNNLGFVSIDDLSDTVLTSLTITNSVNGTATFDIGGGLVEAGLKTLNINGNAELSITGDTVTSGITVAGGTDNLGVTLDSTGATASGATDSITLGNGVDSITLGAGATGSTQTIVLGNGDLDVVSTSSVGTVNVTVGTPTNGTFVGTDFITADSASSLHATAGNGTNVISDTAAGAAIAITVGTGANTITVGTDTTGTISLGAHAATVVDAISIGASDTSLTAIEKISGLNNVGVDTLTFSGDANALTFTQVTAGSVVGSGGNTTLLGDWIAAATGASGSAITGTAHTVTWFLFQGNTYLVETVGADTGALAAGDTVVELTGTSYTFAHTTAAGGVVHLLG